ADGAAPHLPRAVCGRRPGGGTRIDGARRGPDVAGGRRRLLQAAALCLDAVGDRSAESRRAAACGVLPPSVGDRSRSAAPSRRCDGPVPPLPQSPSDRGAAAAAPARLPFCAARRGPARAAALGGARARAFSGGGLMMPSIALAAPTVTESLDAASWDGFVEQHPGASGYHPFAWR